VQRKGKLAQLQQKHEMKMVYGVDSDFFKSSIEPALTRIEQYLKKLPGYPPKSTWLSPFSAADGTVTISYPMYQFGGKADKMDLKPPLKLFGTKVGPKGGAPLLVDWKTGFVDGSVVRVQVRFY
jgi:hypothetical protein